jgi:hypothetical protein
VIVGTGFREPVILKGRKLLGDVNFIFDPHLVCKDKDLLTIYINMVKHFNTCLAHKEKNETYLLL